MAELDKMEVQNLKNSRQGLAEARGERPLFYSVICPFRKNFITIFFNNAYWCSKNTF